MSFINNYYTGKLLKKDSFEDEYSISRLRRMKKVLERNVDSQEISRTMYQIDMQLRKLGVM